MSGGGYRPPGARAWRLSPDTGRFGALPGLLIVLTFTSGLVDAASFLGLGHVFVANMTGNVVFCGFALAGAAGLSATASLTALSAFLLGAAAGGRWRRGARAVPFRPLVGLQTILLAAALVAQQTGASRYPVLVLMGGAMGLQNAVVHRLAVPDLTTTVLTRTLTGLAADRWGAPSLRRLLSALTLFLGALAGALLLLHAGLGWALGLAVAMPTLVAAAPFAGERRGGSRPA
ncbi:YoaK family protein [Streptomyces sp. NPDC056069]|uniref:YoaK family protein n=1 Tax=Streptomyces sp. NPDC056069 TaxID=3345702 RepID=UPI0035D91427